jgi:hypothetical protein
MRWIERLLLLISVFIAACGESIRACLPDPGPA